MNISETNKVMLLFDLTMSYVQSIVDIPRRHMMKKLFNDFNKEGQMLWRYTIKELKKSGQEENFDEHICHINEIFRIYFECDNPQLLITLMHSFNKGDVKIIGGDKSADPAPATKDQRPKTKDQ
jgi:hypothetical protein